MSRNAGDYPLYYCGVRYEDTDDNKRAYEYYLESALSEDYCEAYYRLGRLYTEGEYVSENDPKGYHYFEIAYEKGSRSMLPGDYLMMGTYRHIEVRQGIENGMSRDMVLAIKWYKCFQEACKQRGNMEGYTSAFSHLGRAYQEPEIADYEKAYFCFKESGLKYSRTLLYLAKLHEYGLYVEKDHEKAMEYLDMILDNPEFVGDPFYDCAAAIIRYGSFDKGLGNFY